MLVMPPTVKSFNNVIIDTIFRQSVGNPLMPCMLPEKMLELDVFRINYVATEMQKLVEDIDLSPDYLKKKLVSADAVPKRYAFQRQVYSAFASL